MGLSNKGIFQFRLTKAICLIIFIAAVLLFGATPVSANAMDGMVNCPSGPIQDKVSVPLCCLHSDYPVTNANMVNVLQPLNRFSLSKAAHPVMLRTNLISEASFDKKTLSQRDTPQGVIHPPGISYLCRNSLESEEPPQI